MLKQLVLVGLGGGIGSMLRFAVSTWMARAVQGAFPWPTLLVNLSGCLLIGWLIGLVSPSHPANDQLRLLLVTGFCGGYTTFSTFAQENLTLINQQQWLLAIAYTLLSVILGVLLVWLGLSAGRGS